MVDPNPTIEGLLIGRTFDGHYRLLKPKVLEAPGATRDLAGELFVPCDKVVFVQRLT
jgi:hypothetical protein